MAPQPILTDSPSTDQFNTQLQREFLTSMVCAAKRNVELAYRSLAYLREQAAIIKAHDPQAEIPPRLIEVALAEIETSRELLLNITRLFQIDLDGDA